MNWLRIAQELLPPLAFAADATTNRPRSTAPRQAGIRLPFREFFAFGSGLTFSVLAVAQEFTPSLDYSYEEVELPEAMGPYVESKAVLLENDALLFWDYSKSFYRKATGEWITSPEDFEWTSASSNGYIVGWNRNTETPALWHAVNPDTEYATLNQFAPSGNPYSPLGIADNGEALLSDSDPPYYYLWSGGETTPLIDRYPELDDAEFGVLTILPDGSITGVVREGIQPWTPFTLTTEGITIQSEVSLIYSQFSGRKRFSPNGNVLVHQNGDETTVWGPSFNSVLFPEFHARAINKHGEIVGSYSSTEYDFEDSIVLWNQHDGLIDLNEFIRHPERTAPRLRFYDALSINGSRSILARGLPEEGAFRVAKLYLLKRTPAKERIDSFTTIDESGNIELSAFAHLRLSRLTLMRSSDLETWEQIETVDNPGPSPWNVFQIEPSQPEEFYQIIGEPSSR